MGDTEETTEDFEAVDSHADTDEDQLLETYLVSRERHSEITPSVMDVTVEEGLVAQNDPTTTSLLTARKTADSGIEDATLDDIVAAPEEGVSTALSRIGSRQYSALTHRKAKRLINGKSLGRSVHIPIQRPTLPTRGTTFQTFKWEHVVTATVSDAGLGRDQQLRWTFDDADEARSFTRLLEKAAAGNAKARLQYDDGLALTVETQPSWQEQLATAGIGANALLGAFAFVWLLVFSGSALAALLSGLGLFCLVSAADIHFRDAGNKETRFEDQHQRPFFDAPTLRQGLAETIYDYDGVFQPTAVSVTLRQTDDGITFKPTDPDDNRTWQIPVDDSDTIVHEEHVAFLDEIGSDRVRSGEQLTLWTQATDGNYETPAIRDKDTDYKLYPTNPN